MPLIRRFSAVGCGLLFACVAALLNLHPLAFTTSQSLLERESPTLLQTLPEPGLPIPQALGWNPTTLGTLQSLARTTPAGVIGWSLALIFLFIYGLLRLLNPTFRLTTGVDWDKSLFVRTYMHTAPLIKAFLIGVAAFLPLFLLWLALGVLPVRSEGILCFRMTLIGAVFFILFSREGIAGDYETMNYGFPRTRAVLLPMLLRGGLFGGAVAGILLLIPLVSPERWLLFYRSLGPIGEANWWRVAWWSLGGAGVLGLTGGVFAVALATPGVSRLFRGRWLAAGILLFVLLFRADHVWIPNTLRDRYDYTANESLSAAERLTQKVPLATTETPRQTILLLAGGASLRFQVASRTVRDPLDLSEENANRLEAFLTRRTYLSALAVPALSTLFDAKAFAWEPLENLRVAALDLTHCPETTFVAYLLAKLEICQATPETRRYLDLISDDRQFQFLDRATMVRMGHVTARFGDREGAEKWYRRAKLPESQVQESLSERVMFTEGKITGQVLLDGRPAANLRIGLVPEAARPELRVQVAPRVLRANWLRWLSAAGQTDTEGRFAFDHLVSGKYQIVLGLPNGVLSSDAPPLIATEAPALTEEGGIVFVHKGNETPNVGTVRLMRP